MARSFAFALCDAILPGYHQTFMFTLKWNCINLTYRTMRASLQIINSILNICNVFFGAMTSAVMSKPGQQI